MHLLIALDNSPLNGRILEFLKKYLYQLKEVPVLSFIHVIDSRLFNTISGFPDITMIYNVFGRSFEDEDSIIGQIKKETEGVLRVMQQELGIKGMVEYPIDDPFEAVLQACSKQQPDLLVMGTHSRRGINHFLFGNFAEKIARRINVPLVVIPERVQVSAY